MNTRALRTLFGLSQDMLAEWLGVARSSLALTERGYQSTTATTGVQQLRLELAAQGLVYNGAGGTFPAPLPLPEPEPDAEELGFRLRQCRLKIQGLEVQLETLYRRAAPLRARLVAAPALRAYPGPIVSPEQEQNWLTIFEQEARRQLRTTCGATAIRLLEARLAGLRCEADILAEGLDVEPPAAS
ncbi:helix-turn-helix transcriptional regulator [Hymenobacter psychrotolerans]|uniref:Uncharacterized protein n=1 Tax=Hymenobacter psychrotolerans DSM 18569 TaxID=1121959 RepID=A0A1M6Y3X5_9BACT|nr:helix-turn-helix transcriptional regulator [Hymenobacter psychrotolerans]SHL12970.1 hypothetical protein SAMN02746009_02179 [Hymenobacter psychrotolerans DSM 18569]